MPRAAAKDRITVPISSSGAIRARSRAHRISRTTASTSGMISMLSCVVALSMSSRAAVPPPTWASAAGTAWTASRTRSTVCFAASLSAGAVIVASKRTLPSCDGFVPGGRPRDVGTTPRVPATASPTCRAWAWLLTTTRGSPLPAGKYFPDTSWPTIESGFPVNASALLMPSARSWIRPSEQTTRAAAVALQTIRGRRAIRRPARAHRPLSMRSGAPKCGMAGQNIQRPKITSRAGNRVVIASRATATPIAATGPRPRVEFISAVSRTSMLRTTVAPEARTAGPARCRARAIASWRSS